MKVKAPTCHRCLDSIQVIIRKIGTNAEMKVCRAHADPYVEKPEIYTAEILVDTLRQCPRCGRLIFKNAQPAHHRPGGSRIPCEA